MVALKNIVSGAATMAGVGALRLAVQFMSVPILARLLTPEDYGLLAISMPFVLFAMMIADAGLGSSLVRLPQINTTPWHTCFWILFMLGLLLTASIVAISPLISHLYGDPRLIPILSTMALVIIIQSLSLIPGAMLQHQKRFSKIALCEIIAIVASISTAVYLAYNDYGVWALVGQQLALYTTRLSCMWYYTRYRPVCVLKIAEAKEHLIFARDLLVANLLAFGSRSADNLILGKVAGSASLGFYSMALQFSRLPFMLVTGPLQYALYPHIAAIKDDIKSISSTFLLITRILAIILFPSVALVAAASTPIFDFLLSEKWAMSAWIFVCLAPAAALQPVTSLAMTYLMALGRTDLRLKISAQYAAVWMCVVACTVWYGAAFLAASFSAVVVCFSVWSLSRMLPLFGCTLTDYGKALLMPSLMSLAGIAAYKVIDQSYLLEQWMQIGLAALITCVSIGSALWLQRRDIVALKELASTPSSS